MNKKPWCLLVGGMVALAAIARSADPAPPMNVLLIIADDLRPLLGCYGDKLAKTPNIDRLASLSVRFDRAYATYPICGPSRASMLSGRRPLTTNYYGWEAVPNVMQLPAWFKQHGYYTASFGKVYHTDRLALPKVEKRKATGVGKTVNPPGSWDVSDPCVTAEDTDGYGYSYSVTLGEEDVELSKHVVTRGDASPPLVTSAWQWMEWAALDVPDEKTSDGVLVRRAAAAITQAVGEKKKFFVAAGLRRPHQLLAAPKKYFDLYDANDMPRMPQEPREHVARLSDLALTYPKKFAYQLLSDDSRRQLERGYRANIAFMDAQVGELLRVLDEQNLWKNTVVILTSDHGWHLGEHGGLANKHTLFEESARVPLLVFSPAARQNGTASGYPVELVDIFPTLVELCGLPASADLDGLSLKPLLSGEKKELARPGAISVVRRTTPQGGAAGGSAFNPPVTGISLRTAEWRYTEWDGGKLGAELYHESVDPLEYDNLADDPAYAHTRAELKAQLAAAIARPGPGATGAQSP